MSDWTLIEKKTPPTGRTNGFDKMDFHFLYYTSFNDDDEQALFGTIYQKFEDPKWKKDADGKDTLELEAGIFYPEVDKNLRYCIQLAPKSLAQPAGYTKPNDKYAGFEHVMFFNAGW